MKPVIWINLDPEKIDLACLAERLGEKYRLIARAIPGNDPQEVRRRPWRQTWLSAFSKNGMPPSLRR